MAKKYTGAVGFANGFSYASAVPMDDRSVVPTLDDLKNPDTWKKNGVFFAYQGMSVTVADSGETYKLIASEINNTTIADQKSWFNECDWEEI